MYLLCYPGSEVLFVGKLKFKRCPKLGPLRFSPTLTLMIVGAVSARARLNMCLSVSKDNYQRYLGRQLEREHLVLRGISCVCRQTRLLTECGGGRILLRYFKIQLVF